MSGVEQGELLGLAGGLEGLRAVIETFYDRVFDDVMIGFLFWKTDKARLIEKEVEFAARMLGARDVVYTGKPIREAHAPHRIMGGHFDRRLQILKDSMAHHGLPEAVRVRWVQHTAALRPLVTADKDSNCSPEAAERRLEQLRAEGLID
jgi:hemoglobin